MLISLKQNNINLTHIVEREEFKTDIIKEGDVIEYLWAESYRSKRKHKYYGVVTRVERDTLWIFSKSSNSSDRVPMEFGISSKCSDCIIAVYSNGEKVDNKV